MNGIDFERDGQIGDEVWHPIRGNGKLSNISHNIVCVLFEDGFTESFGSRSQYLCWGHRGDPIDRGSPPMREPKRLEFTGKPVWALVSNTPNGWKTAPRRQVIASNGSIYLVVSDGDANTETIICTRYEYAWEIEDEQH